MSTTEPTTPSGQAMVRRLGIHWAGCTFSRGPKAGMDWPDVTSCDCGALREILAIERETGEAAAKGARLIRVAPDLLNGASRTSAASMTPYSELG